MILSAEVDEAILAATANPDAAAKVLLIAARHLRTGRPMPDNLRSFLASAFEVSMTKRKSLRGPSLLKELMLTYGNKRPSDVSIYSVGNDFQRLIDQGVSQNKAASEVADKYEISVATARRKWKEWKWEIEAERQWDEEASCDQC
jgi:hypothetical protein